MRDTHESMPELLAAYERDGQYFGSVRITISGASRAFEFGVPFDGFRSLRRILQTRPFDQMPGIQYRYFIGGSIGPRAEDRAVVDIRIEQGRDGRLMDFEVPLLLARNFYWFKKLKNYEDASHLHVIDEAAPEV